MATSVIRKYPIGIQSFEKLRRGQYIYVDKTDLVYQLATAGNPCFLSRPRRFGKSLLLSTFEAYFLGKKELFTGLAVEQLETEWAVHPVFHLDLNAERYDSVEELDNMLESQLSRWEQTYGITQPNRSISIRFMDVIREASVQTGRGVVVLIDEYDKPLLRSFHNEELQQQFRNRLTAFYTVLKSADPWLRFVFITGVTKFAQMSVFSELNQLTDISQLPQYATLCGMTRSEIEDSFAPDIEELGRLNNLTTEEVMNKLTRLYDGYRFSEYATEGIYNPFSLLSVMSHKVFKDYWFSSGTPTFLVKMLKETDYDLRELDGIEVPSAALISYRANSKEPVPMIYQSGYLTIKSYDKEFKTYTLGFPNEEVRYGFLNFVLPFYTPIDSEEGNFYIGKFVQELRKGDPEAFLTRLRAFFADIPYELNDKTERHYQVVFYLVFKLLGQFAEAEVRSAKGRADAVVKTADYIYVFEFKLDGTVDEAIHQIDDKGYLIPYTTDGRKLVKVGVSFSREERNLGEWVIKG
ncbi:AAA family ATPase [Parabacteroides sp. AF48-14]|uniref:ATP-binding protein n=1 Tax=Parabacteroides sp. AF48-14 TaxID=2292052 RepID=UPI000F0025A9|nr:ATP-binding protein [Parabacteroides sp. AF48-14]RHO75284.1 AAA family ATPase [Parabacteroides sp. AF48-14]